MNNIIKKLFNNSKYRRISILAILVFILICVIIHKIMNIEEPLPEGSLRVVVCTQCNTTYIERIKNIENTHDKRNSCKECHGKLAIAWKCNECQFQYPELKLADIQKNLKTTMDKFQAIVESRRCPNCASLSAHAMSVNEIKRKTRIAAK